MFINYKREMSRLNLSTASFKMSKLAHAYN